MFKNLSNFSYKRSNTEAFGFYIAYFFLIIAVSVGLALLMSIVLNIANSYSDGVNIGTGVAMILSTGLAGLIVKAKNLQNDPKYLVIAASALVLGLIGGALLGLLPATYLSTRDVEVK